MQNTLIYLCSSLGETGPEPIWCIGEPMALPIGDPCMPGTRKWTSLTISKQNGYSLIGDCTPPPPAFDGIFAPGGVVAGEVPCIGEPAPEKI